MSFDLNPPRYCPVRPSFYRYRIFLLPFIILMAAACLLMQAKEHPWFKELRAKRQAAVSVAAPVPQKVAPVVPEVKWETVRGTIEVGDSISSLLGHLLTVPQIADLEAKSRKVYALSRIGVGQPYKLILRDGAFDRFEYDIDRQDLLVIQQAATGLQVTREPIPYVVKEKVVAGTVTDSLSAAIASVGEGDSLGVSLASVFAWDIDFHRDIRLGDTFRVLVEKRTRDGEPAGYGRVLAASFVNQGEEYQAFWFKDGNRAPGYYDEKGRSLRKAFLRAPLDFSRISSGYTTRRLHPVTKKYKSHPAIDYAAPTGTPIKTVGDGTVVAVAYNRYNGNYVKVRHANGWATLYNHMSRFATNLKKGQRIRQGQVIGFVGSTGLSTGPHLDYRMYKNGKTVNPLKVKSPAAVPVSKKRMAEFRSTIKPLVARMVTAPVATAQVAAVSQGDHS